MTQARRSVVSRRGPQPTATYPHATVQGNLVWVTAQAGRDRAKVAKSFAFTSAMISSSFGRPAAFRR